MPNEFYKRNKKVRDKYDQSEFRDLGKKVTAYCEQYDLFQPINILSERNSMAWFYLCEGNHGRLRTCFINTYKHLGFGNATTPIIVIDKLFNHFFPEKANPITRWAQKDSSEINAANQVTLSLQTAISDFNVATDQFLQQNTCPQKTDAGNAPIATKNM